MVGIGNAAVASLALLCRAVMSGEGRPANALHSLVHATELRVPFQSSAGPSPWLQPRESRIQFPPRPSASTAIEPLRRIHLVTGETLTGEILNGRPDAVEFRMFGQSRYRIPKHIISRIAGLPGERVLLNENFADASRLQFRIDGDGPWHFHRSALVIPATGEPLRLLLPEGRGDFVCCFRLRTALTDRDNAPVPVKWSARFPNGRSLETWLDSEGCWQTRDPQGSAEEPALQTIAWRPVWQTFRLRTIGRQMYLSVDDQLLFSGVAPDKTLSALEFTVPRSQQPAAGATDIDHLSLVDLAAPSIEFPPPQTLVDAIVGVEGETWWGDVRSVDAHGVEWTNGETAWHRSWRDVTGVVFQASPHAVAGKILSGNVVQIELGPHDRPDLPGDQITAVLGAGREGWLNVDHPLLGRLAIPYAAIRQARPRFLGEWQLCDGRETLLGESSPPPNHELRGEFVLKHPPAGAICLSVDVSGMEPGGPQTPPGSPALGELRAGKLATEVWINDQRLGTLNELTSDWSLPGKFDRLRFPLRADALQSGRNTWRLRQTPGGGARQRFDECRLRNVAIEIDALP